MAVAQSCVAIGIGLPTYPGLTSTQADFVEAVVFLERACSWFFALQHVELFFGILELGGEPPFKRAPHHF